MNWHTWCSSAKAGCEIRSVPGSAGALPEVTIGAGVKLALIAESALLSAYPAFTSAAAQIAGPQIRNMGTLGGRLCQRNRCWYFRDEHVNCLLKGGDKCFAINGDHRYHAAFAKGHKCIIVHPSTLAPGLIALGASAEVLGPKGKRTVKLSEFFRAPTGPSEREHVLAAKNPATRLRRARKILLGEGS